MDMADFGHSAATAPWDDIRRLDPALDSTGRAYSPASTSNRSSPNRVRAKAADPHVISSILTSLDALTPLPSDHQFDSASRHSLPASSNKSIASSASAYRTSGFGVEYGTGLQLDDEDGMSDAALPPIIPTSRSPSGISHYTASRNALSTRPSAAAVFRAALPGSRRSSFSTTSDRPPSRKNKLSSESWVRQNADGDDRSVASRGRTPRKGLRRVSSQEMLRAPRSASPPPPSVQEYPTVSLAEQIIARAPPPPLVTSKGRLYLTDATATEDSPPGDSPIYSPQAFSLPEFKQSPESEPQAIADGQLRTEDILPLKSPSPISDSIPTRTSSLRHSSNSPASRKRKHRKSKKPPGASGKSEMLGFKRSPSIPDAKWEDLGEDDETVKRIKELRERRKSRLNQEESYHPPSRKQGASDLSALLQAETPVKATYPPSPIRPAAEAAIPRSTPNMIRPSAPLNGLQGNVLPDESLRKTQHSVDMRRRPASAQQYRPTTSASDVVTFEPAALEYSYARAVDLLDGVNGIEDGIENSRRAEDARESQDLPQQHSLQLKGLDLQTAQAHISITSPRLRSSRRIKKFSPNKRNEQPNNPLDFGQRKNRRQSMSDARLARAMEQEIQLARRDSIEDAVLGFLNAPRLSKMVYHPTTGRAIAFSEVGDPQGAAVFICVGMGLTRYVTAFYDDLAITLRLRLITIDRPGVGASEPLPSSDRSGPLSWPEDVLTVCQQLGIGKFSLLAHSAGAIYALATALILPHLVKGKVHLLAPWVPPSQLEAVSHSTASAPPANPLPRSQRFLRVIPAPFLKAANTSFMTATSASLKPATKRTAKCGAIKSPPRRQVEPIDSPKRPASHDRPEYNRRESMMLMDRYIPETNPLEHFPLPILDEKKQLNKRENLIVSATATPMDPNLAYANAGLHAAEHAEKERQLEYGSRLTQLTWELATRDSNPATDLLVCLERIRDVGFRYTDVGCEVVITHGSEDKRVPLANVKWLAEQMNRRAMEVGLGQDARQSKESYLDASAKGGCEVRVLEGEGHGLMASPSIMGDILTEIAGY